MSEKPRVLAIDDDPTTLVLIERTLKRENYSVQTFEEPTAGLEAFRREPFDFVLIDYFMPGINGDAVMREIRREDADVPIVFLTANDDIRTAIELVRNGADDYISKPVVAEEILFRIERNLREKKLSKAIEQTEKERELLELENQKLVNWRSLYASKDIHQSKQMIDLLSRTINHSGGFMWIDLLRATPEPIDDDYVKVSKALVETVLHSAESQKGIFDYITFISRVDELELNLETVEVAELTGEIETYIEQVLGDMCGHHGREKLVMRSKGRQHGRVAVDMTYLKKVVHELLVNAVKYSPEGSRIVAYTQAAESDAGGIDIVVRNSPRETRAKDGAGNRIYGIPYDYSELVFNLFYTIDGFPTVIDEEEWGYGTGLFVARKLLQRMHGWLATGNGVDYTGDAPETFVRFTASVPDVRKGERNGG